MMNTMTLGQLTVRRILVHLLEEQPQSDPLDQPISMQPQPSMQSQASGADQDQWFITRKQLQIFQDCMTQAPGLWIQLLDRDAIQSDCDTIDVNRPSTLSKLYYSIIDDINWRIEGSRVQSPKLSTLHTNKHHQCNQEINQVHENGKSQIKIYDGPKFQQKYMDQTSLALMAEVLNNYAHKISSSFQYGKQTITKQAQKIDEQIKKSEIMNTYMLFGMLKQMASSTQWAILDNLALNFKHLTEYKRRQFCKYVQKNYEFVDLHCKVNVDAKIMTRKQLEDYAKEQNQKWLKFLKDCEQRGDVKLKRIQSSDGNKGILLLKKQNSTNKLKQQEKSKKQQSKPKEELAQKIKQQNHHFEQSAQQYVETPELIFRIENQNQIRVTSARACQQSWRIFNTQDSMSELYEMLRKQIEISGKDKDNDYYSYAVPTCEYATIGGSLGKCLADINQYKNANQFLLDLSKTTAIFSTLSYAMAEIPILSYFIVAGGFTYSFYLACSNKATSSYKKMNEVGIATMTAVGSVGSTLGGILLGQAIIPVPFLGAFIGGIVGGFFGTRGVRKINKFLYKANFRDIIQYLKSKLIMKRYWKCTKYLLQRIGIDQKYFISHAPASEHGRDVYVTAICFCIVTFYESKRYVERNQQKMLEYKKTKKAVVSEDDIVDIADFLTQEKFIILNEIQQLQNFIIHLSA